MTRGYADRFAGRFSGRTAIVTGAGGGIGGALTRALVAAGATVVCADLALDAAEQAAATQGPGAARAVRLDVTDAAAVQALVDEVVDEQGRLDLMFNNAGITLLGDTEDLTLAQWNAIIDVNLRGVVHGVVAAYPQMIRQGGGHLVNTASMGGLMAAGLLTSYVATKHAVVGLSLALRSEAAARGVGVTVVCPAAVETQMLDQGEIGPVKGRDYYLKGQGSGDHSIPTTSRRRSSPGCARTGRWSSRPDRRASPGGWAGTHRGSRSGWRPGSSSGSGPVPGARADGPFRGRQLELVPTFRVTSATSARYVMWVPFAGH